MVGDEPQQYTPPPLVSTQLETMLLLMRVGEEPEVQHSPPPLLSTMSRKWTSLAPFSEMVLPVRVGEE
jgi:hypothetical protein